MHCEKKKTPPLKEDEQEAEDKPCRLLNVARPRLIRVVFHKFVVTIPTRNSRNLRNNYLLKYIVL